MTIRPEHDTPEQAEVKLHEAKARLVQARSEHAHARQELDTAKFRARLRQVDVENERVCWEVIKSAFQCPDVDAAERYIKAALESARKISKRDRRSYLLSYEIGMMWHDAQRRFVPGLSDVAIADLYRSVRDRCDVPPYPRDWVGV